MISIELKIFVGLFFFFFVHPNPVYNYALNAKINISKF